MQELLFVSHHCQRCCSPPKWLLIEQTGNSKPRTELLIYGIHYTCRGVLKLAAKICSSICFCDQQIAACAVLFLHFWNVSVMRGSGWDELTDIRNVETMLGVWMFTCSSPSFSPLPLVFMPFISMASQCSLGIAAALAPCVRQRERSVSTPSILQSHTVMSKR